MKYITYTIEDQTLEFYNSILGRESVVLNGKKISEKRSFFGTEHYFTIGEDNYSIRPSLDFSSIWGIGFKLHRNGLPLNISGQRVKKNKWMVLAFVLAGLAIGFSVGYYTALLIF
ncbi:hypothetical protein ACFQZJ_04220 [Maribacter chungangensis]|uniref:Uncharacterized protein n=1 Tax=Maribacter chungangensis TaxID=1069117 RepID=A0ABW3B031_9FLAO